MSGQSLNPNSNNNHKDKDLHAQKVAELIFSGMSFGGNHRLQAGMSPEEALLRAKLTTQKLQMIEQISTEAIFTNLLHRTMLAANSKETSAQVDTSTDLEIERLSLSDQICLMYMHLSARHHYEPQSEIEDLRIRLGDANADLAQTLASLSAIAGKRDEFVDTLLKSIKGGKVDSVLDKDLQRAAIQSCYPTKKEFIEARVRENILRSKYVLLGLGAYGPSSLQDETALVEAVTSGKSLDDCEYPDLYLQTRLIQLEVQFFYG